MLIKVKFIKNEKPCGREYTYKSSVPVNVDDVVELPNGGTGIVTAVDVPESEVEGYKDKIKEVIGKKMKRPEKLNGFIKACIARAEKEFFETFKDFGISEQEAKECMEFLEANEGKNILDL